VGVGVEVGVVVVEVQLLLLGAHCMSCTQTCEAWGWW